MGTLQDTQNQAVIDFAKSQFSTQTHEYGRHDMKGDIANKRTGERIDGSRFNEDLDGDGRKGVDCSSMVYYSLKGAGFNVEQMSKTPFGTGALFNGYHTEQGVKKANLTSEAAQNFDYVQGKDNLKPGDVVMFKMSATAQHVAIYAGKNERGENLFFGSQTSTGPKMVNFDTDPYWSKREYLGALRPKEEFIKPEFRQQGDSAPEMKYNGSQLESVKKSSLDTPDGFKPLGNSAYTQTRSLYAQAGIDFADGGANTVAAVTYLAAQKGITEIEQMTVKDGQIHIAQKDPSGFGYTTASIDAIQAANTDYSKSMDGLAALNNPQQVASLTPDQNKTIDEPTKARSIA